MKDIEVQGHTLDLAKVTDNQSGVGVSAGDCSGLKDRCYDWSTKVKRAGSPGSAGSKHSGDHVADDIGNEYCKNGGRCYSSWFGRSCDCSTTDSFGGDKCEACE